MATTKKITMKQFNGTDYDTLYPKTDVKQVKNLTPSSIGAVAKSGDTMTGNLNITNSNPYLELVETDSQEKYLVQVHQGDFYIGASSHGSTYGLVLKPDGTILAKALYTVLHTGNAQSLGFPKIAIGSYVGTGTFSSANPNSLTFDFVPKLVIIVADARTNFPGTVFINGQSQSESIGHNYISNYQFTVGWSGNTVTWYTTNSNYGAEAQLNKSGVTYRYIALG